MATAYQYWDGDTSTDYGTAGNWRLADGTAGAVPLITDVVTFPSGCANAVAGGDYNGVALLSFTVKDGYSGTMGSATNGFATALQIAATTFNFAGSGVSYIDLTANSTTTCNVTKAAPSPGIGEYGLTLSSADTIANLNISLASGESVGVAALAGQTGTFTNVNIDGAGTITLGSGMATITALAIGGTGTVYIDCTYTTLTISGNPTVYQRSGAGTTLICQGGRFYNNSTGTIAATNIFPGATVDCTDGPMARAMTTINVYGDGGFDDSAKRTTWTTLNDYGSGTNIKLGTNKKITRAAIA